jgi:hydroxyethylthiazole kinase-like uncharacterized protein yjeF
MSTVSDPRLHPESFWPRFRQALDEVDPETTRPPPDARTGAVLVLLEDTPDGPQLVLTRRRRDMRSHPGQVSFPGGRLDPDETIEEAALREAQEEVGLEPDSVELVGVGPAFYIPPSRFWVVPVAGRWVRPHELRPNPWEVDTILHVPVAHLLEQERWRHVPLSLRGSSWAWQLEEDLLWGATAIVCALMLDVVVPGWSGGMTPADLDDELAVRPWEQAPVVVRRARLGDGLPSVPRRDVPHVTVDQMRVVDDLLDGQGLGLASLVEQAGRGVVHAVRRLLDRTLDGAQVTVAAGSGGNGAGGLAAARLLSAAGAEVTVLLTGPPRLAAQASVLSAAGIRMIEVVDEVPDGVDPGDGVVDAMLGIGARPPLGGRPEVVAAWLRRHDVPVVALDLPSGIGGDIGLRGPCVTADVTVTLGAPKVGMLDRITDPYVGDLYLADLGIPPAVWRRAGVDMPPSLFASGPLVRLTVTEGVASDAGTPDQGQT